jgi:8-oxo-dGTP pyrophosphatase MutT (NUDIX family)
VTALDRVTGFSPEAVRARAAERLLPHEPAAEVLTFGDETALERVLPLGRDRLKPAAVLVPLVARDDVTVLLTQRTDALRAHAGQVAFPGGRIDPEDGGALRAALREAREEIGLEGRFVEFLGYLDPYVTSSSFLVQPCVALVEPGFTLALNTQEVAEAFETPLAFLMNPVNHKRGSRLHNGRTRRFYEMPYGGYYIWGATAGIIRNLYERLYG